MEELEPLEQIPDITPAVMAAIDKYIAAAMVEIDATLPGLLKEIEAQLDELDIDLPADPAGLERLLKDLEPLEEYYHFT